LVPAIAVSILLLLTAGFLAFSADQRITEVLTRFSPFSIGLVFLFLTIGALLASLRLKLIAADMGYSLSFRDAIAALSAGQVAGSIFFQLAGQLIGRAALLSRRDMAPDATVFLTAYERILALFVALALAGSGALYLFGRLTLDLTQGGGALLKLAMGLALAISVGAAVSWWPIAKPFVMRANTLPTLISAARNLVISLVIQLLTIAAYVVAALMFAPDSPFLDIVAASAIVMLAASLPISFGGWGVREISAMVALGFVGLASTAAFMVGLLIGVTSLAIVLALALATARAWNFELTKKRPAPERRIDYGAALDWIIPIAAATAVFFQLHVPVREGFVNVNLADPVAILAGSLTLVRARMLWDHAITAAFVLFAVVICAAWLHGIVVFGFTDWATTKMLGWFVLLGYAATGAFLASRPDGFRTLLLTFVGAALGICALELVLVTAAGVGFSLPQDFLEWPISGFSQNRNAFSFALLLALAAIFVTEPRHANFMSGLILAVLVIAGSRAGYGTIFVLFAAAIAIGAVGMKQLRMTALWTMVCLAPLALSFLVFDADVLRTPLSTPESNAERMKTILDGVQIFLNHPLFGAGLGYYFRETLSAGHALVIHSTAIWLLAEIGLVGLVAASIMAAVMARAAWRPILPAAKLLFLLLVVFAVMSTVHEMFYQRAWWLLAGAALAAIRRSALLDATGTPHCASERA
jgi:uncharacterized membrane protein YbhN (UPF0104 family)